MKTKISKFIKTEQFLNRQFDRKVDDNLLTEALRGIRPPKGKRLLVISRDIIRKFCGLGAKELIIVTNGRLLLTCFFKDITEYIQTHSHQKVMLIQ